MIDLKKEDCYCDILTFYQNVAKKMGIMSTDSVGFDCRKINTTKPVLDEIISFYKNEKGYSDFDIGTSIVMIGPKASLDGTNYTVEVLEGFIITAVNK